MNILELSAVDLEALLYALGMAQGYASKQGKPDLEERLIKLAAEIQRSAESEAHDYRSTACYHGLHGRCRMECKFCGVPCKCECHVKQDQIQEVDQTK